MAWGLKETDVIEKDRKTHVFQGSKYVISIRMTLFRLLKDSYFSKKINQDMISDKITIFQNTFVGYINIPNPMNSHETIRFDTKTLINHLRPQRFRTHCLPCRQLMKNCRCLPWYPSTLAHQTLLGFVRFYMHFDYRYSGWWLSNPSEKYELINWDDDIPSIWKNKTCSKPPTRVSISFNISL